jgi:hypothetical protein
MVEGLSRTEGLIGSLRVVCVPDSRVARLNPVIRGIEGQKKESI